MGHLLLLLSRNAAFLVDDGLGEPTDALECRPHQLKVVVLRAGKGPKHVCELVAIKARQQRMLVDLEDGQGGAVENLGPLINQGIKDAQVARGRKDIDEEGLEPAANKDTQGDIQGLEVRIKARIQCSKDAPKCIPVDKDLGDGVVKEVRREGGNQGDCRPKCPLRVLDDEQQQGTHRAKLDPIRQRRSVHQQGTNKSPQIGVQRTLHGLVHKGCNGRDDSVRRLELYIPLQQMREIVIKCMHDRVDGPGEDESGEEVGLGALKVLAAAVEEPGRSTMLHRDAQSYGLLHG